MYYLLLQQVGQPLVTTQEQRGFLVPVDSANQFELTLILSRDRGISQKFETQNCLARSNLL